MTTADKIDRQAIDDESEELNGVSLDAVKRARKRRSVDRMRLKYLRVSGMFLREAA